ncbi:nitroreductase family protein [Mannheimia sp. AT1]|uniref:Putative NAD(P)H nitroreductase n=1 Tax=Mannheimia cairinae TaxID=3025936 RepID=A0ABT5MP15_9PAST|nr:nitroreductase family protein [Mannheimia cairinae]MDD0823920.1 nitroreductase family protein [Mannheimia cairinae]MDD0825236.1 nitroreductase family protein [Mannheimia cairinae]
MQSLDLLLHRRSSKKLGDKAPNPEQLEQILKAGLRAPDHGRLKPYHFVVIEKSGMPQLREYLTSAVEEFGLSEEHLKKAEGLSNRAPMIIGVVAKLDHNIAKVPAWEQMLTAGCATYAIQLAANSLGFDTVWITNKWINGSDLRSAFGCQEGDKIIALVMIGSPLEGEINQAKETENLDGFVSYIK